MITELGTNSGLPRQLGINVPLALEKREAPQPSLSPPEPRISEKAQDPGMKVSDIPKTETVSYRTA